MKPGDIIEPPSSMDHLLDGCPVCEARKRGQQHAEDDNDPSMVYVTTDRDYARIYAAGYPRGALYVVEPIGELVDRSAHDAAPSWGCRSARVVSVYDPVVVFSAKQTQQAIRRYRRNAAF